MNKSLLTVFILVVVIAMLAATIQTLSGCGPKGSTTATTSGGLSYSRDIQSIFNSSCVICHQGTGQAGLSLEPAVSYGELVGVPSTESNELRVKVGAPEQSYLIAKLMGTQVQAGGSGALMPLNAAPLSQAQIDLIRQWISGGALNN